ncbi:endoribonuclease L-PSP [Capronia epimyces CBS 606.96]|uniref:Endoribonuclease L-PSP n=1 Tax=Capronia epimyces CBS 606.96 TaxID=1182542 RepID=W9Y985_9EURO|nr:endoribonuclease L-PSP [Capronia epimyces CBS 606.96]EXJ78934.1 endoribonuclease L-PSP [Capronia epimyces CBS 606.96]
MGVSKVLTNKAPAPRGLLSQAIICNGMVYCSGATGVDPATNKLILGNAGDRTTQTLRNLAAVLEAAGSSIRNVVKVNVYLTSMDDFREMNAAYEQVFKYDPKPARTCVQVTAFPAKTDVEIDLIAAV